MEKTRLVQAESDRSMSRDNESAMILFFPLICADTCDASKSMSNVPRWRATTSCNGDLIGLKVTQNAYFSA